MNQRGGFVVIPKLAVHRESNGGEVPLVFTFVRVGTGPIAVLADGPE